MEYFFYNTDARAIHDEPRPRYPRLIQGNFAATGGDREKFGEQFNQLNPADILLMYENGIGVVAVGRVMEKWDGVTHATPRYYTPAEFADLSGGPHEYRIAVDWFLDLSDVPIGLAELRKQFGLKSSASTVTRGAIDRIVKQRDKIIELIEGRRSSPILPGELSASNTYFEGASRQISVNAYERNRGAVADCKRHYGSACLICGFDFGKTFGAEFAGFIHVHHLLPLSTIGKEYQVNPINDLRPVCPNCHAIIHHGGKLRSIAEVKSLLDKQR